MTVRDAVRDGPVVTVRDGAEEGGAAREGIWSPRTEEMAAAIFDRISHRLGEAGRDGMQGAWGRGAGPTARHAELDSNAAAGSSNRIRGWDFATRGRGSASRIS